MRRVWGKLKSSAGASILFAILVFMLCILAGTAALTAAAANSGRYTHLKAEQQKYLAVSSAAKLMRNQLAKNNFTATKVTTTTDPGSGGTPSTTSDGYKISDENFTFSDSWFTDCFEKAANGESISPNQKTFTITLDDVPDVTADVTVSANYQVTVELYVGTEKDNLTNLTLVPTRENLPTETVRAESGGNVTTTTTQKFTVTWQEENAVISQGRN